ncbi:fructan beta-fructosidase [Arthrobacter sp. ok909]|uniref:glycoside hydrolase family 32 protein n=1 Tax=Arthrobacter sp. ok909 TaxID=1761746 RepID=UPI000885D84B|nr:glycoside hydrolase family 32 protein [Arthrobacter sp. ok909]SDO97142.1 fructan beta-fructosidase [Arthrobacter sp. ok909]
MNVPASAVVSAVPESAASLPLSSDLFRPEWHYSAGKNWLNDPNGLIHLNGTYHLFYQHNPSGDAWGNMSWGHATSPDLLHWEEQPVAIPCDGNEAIFSGSVVFDPDNTSGFGTPGTPPLVAVYTSAYTDASPVRGRQAQSLAFSLDQGQTWTKYAGNPVLDRASANFRDPKVFRYDGPAGSYWVMAAVEATDCVVVLYRSADLKDWEYLSSFGPANATGGDWECPDLFPLAVDGRPADTKWVLVVNLNPGGIAGGSGAQYFTGTFDGVHFRSETTVTEGLQPDGSRMPDYAWLDRGRDYYAAVSFNDAPGGRRITIGWMNNWDYAGKTPTKGWRGAMSLAREVTLTRLPSGGVVLRQAAIDPFGGPDARRISLGSRELHPGTVDLVTPESGAAGGGLGGAAVGAAPSAAARIDVAIEPGTAAKVGLLLRTGGAERTVLAYDTATSRLSLDRRESGAVEFHENFASVEHVHVPLDGGRLRLQVYLDACSVEVFAQDGLAVLTDLVFPAESSTGMALFAEGHGARVRMLDIRRR